MAGTHKIELDLSDANQELLDKAASNACLSVDDYILSCALKQARKELLDTERIVLSAADSKLILDALSSPSEPIKALRELFK